VSSIVWYWIVARDENGKRYLLSGGRTEDEARQRGMEMLSQGEEWEIKRLHTQNLERASHELKFGVAERSRNISKAGERWGHDKTLRRKAGMPSQPEPSQPGSGYTPRRSRHITRRPKRRVNLMRLTDRMDSSIW